MNGAGPLMAEIADRTPARRVLLAEDNVVSQRVAAAFLEHLGFNVDVVTDGRQAVRAATRTVYHAILMDCQIPVVDGFRASREIRRLKGSSCRTPIIAVTASSASDHKRCLAAGMNGCLAKPLSLKALTAAMTRWAPDWQAPMLASERSAAEHGPIVLHSIEDQVVVVAPAVLDRQILGRLERLGRTAGEDLVGQVAKLFLADADACIVAMRVALKAADTAAIVRLAHALSGASANLGATDLVRSCTTLETQASGGDLVGGAATLDVLEAELERVRTALLSPALTT
jgi:two-component system sensor histidine kinase/response regulator